MRREDVTMTKQKKEHGIYITFTTELMNSINEALKVARESDIDCSRNDVIREAIELGVSIIKGR